MPHSFGVRGRTRKKFSRDFRTNGVNPLSIYLINYKIGDYVDIKANPSVHKGMPHKVYHGKTGVIWNITNRAIGVKVNKQVNGRIIVKKIIVRVEHLRPSRCRSDLQQRIVRNAKLLKEAKGKKVVTKRLPKQPKEAFTLKYKGKEPELIQALPFVDLV
mmetsp:Transcript_10572/g.15845  ORF Transcript_10572/g.15845 Transcript_10572/m.15845 type:complete len:159 (-) Transcript_10572:32-508(-)|eukprot:CAMPEP_0171455182 /NCGR_PEP_ID=MMETSP0945-20130129/2179_1 /TAXON_ID=109269 /ORGANISM="Vaucheria litorea, Strain CCMP2940" /LENGTH=158 /DNA_ID=CAMNT_0011980371 /DNA_START=118 /DNA_END=594 /DNA_ORIENTATION=+